MTFTTLGLSPPILKALAELHYDEPTDIQEQAIPIVLAGRNLIANAATGTGKTASFVLPVLDLLSRDHQRHAKRVRALVLVPTRELAMQVEKNICQYGRYLSLRSLAMVGGVDMEPQKQQLIDGVDILVATPGRLVDMIHQRAVILDELEVLVLDEADRMLDMGFSGEINRIIQRLPAQRQNLLFSATMSDEVRVLGGEKIENPFEISISLDTATPSTVSQWLVAVDKSNKSSLLSHLVQELEWKQALIFIRTKHGAAKLVSQLEKRGIQAESIHGGRSQAARTQILSDFKSGDIGLLVATGVAARGIDIDHLERVVNYDLPDDADEYIHRVGRTGRAGASGEAVSLVSYDDFKRLCAIERRLDRIVERKTFEAFPAVKDLPVSNLNFFKGAPSAKLGDKGGSSKPKPPKEKMAKKGEAKEAILEARVPQEKTESERSPRKSLDSWEGWGKLKPSKK